MKNILSILTTVALLVTFSCQQPKQLPENYQDEVKQKIAETLKLYLEAWENEDLDSSMTFIDEEYINMFSFGPSQTKEEGRESFKNVFDTYSVEDVEYTRVECIVDKNYAFETWFFKQKWVTNDKQDTILFDMRGLTVLKKQEDGSWKMFRLMGQQ